MGGRTAPTPPGVNLPLDTLGEQKVFSQAGPRASLSWTESPRKWTRLLVSGMEQQERQPPPPSESHSQAASLSRWRCQLVGLARGRRPAGTLGEAGGKQRPCLGLSQPGILDNGRQRVSLLFALSLVKVGDVRNYPPGPGRRTVNTREVPPGPQPGTDRGQ